VLVRFFYKAVSLLVKFLCKAVSLLVSVLGGILAGAIFKRVWKLAAGEDEAPTATGVRRGWAEVLAAAALQGAIFALVKAALDRGLLAVPCRSAEECSVEGCLVEGMLGDGVPGHRAAA
jgi:hypothetical protein